MKRPVGDRMRAARLWKLAFVVSLCAGIAGLGAWATRGIGASPLARGEIAYARHDWAAAENNARGALKADGSDRKALRLLARALARRGHDDSAEAIYRRLGTKLMEAEDYFLLGRGLLNRGEVGPALASLGAARDVNPDHAEALDALSEYWVKTRTLADALEATERLAKQPGWETRGQVRLATLRSAMFDPAGAASALAAALNRDPNLTDADLGATAARRLMARCLLQAGKPALARAQLELEAAPHAELKAEGPWLLSRAFLQEGQIGEAIKALEAARRAAPSDPLAHEPAPFLGAARCAGCHAAIHRSQQSSRHSRTLVRTADLPKIPWPHKSVPDPDNTQVAHQFRPSEQHVDVVTRVKDEAFRAVVEFAMGSNHHGQSFLAREEAGQVRELRISHYPSAPEWGRTMEHPAQPPDEPGYLGRPISSEAYRRCLHCHSTHFRAILEPNGRPEARDRGIGCERCHGPGGNHALAVGTSFPDLAIARPNLATAARIVALCGECHSAPRKDDAE